MSIFSFKINQLHQFFAVKRVIKNVFENFPLPENFTLQTFKAQVNLELDEHCHEHYESDSESENEIEIESVPEISNETVTTSEFLNHLSSINQLIHCCEILRYMFLQ